MSTQNTLYIAEPIFSKKLQEFDPDSTFPPVKKIGITTDHPKSRERELLGTLGPVKVAMVKAWTNIDAMKVESMLHGMLENTRLDGEYFWDGNEILVDSVTRFISEYHPEAEEITLSDDPETREAEEAMESTYLQRTKREIVPQLEELSIPYRIVRRGRAVKFDLGEYSCRLGCRTNDRYTFTAASDKKTTEQALAHFPGSRSAGGFSEKSKLRARISMRPLDEIMDIIKEYQGSLG